MKAIGTETDLRDLLDAPMAILFLDANWSEYARISKLMVEHIEKYVHMKRSDIVFYCGQFEGGQLQLAQDVVDLGVSSQSFSGNGSLAFFIKGRCVENLNSVMASGTEKVWSSIRVHFK